MPRSISSNLSETFKDIFRTAAILAVFSIVPPDLRSQDFLDDRDLRNAFEIGLTAAKREGSGLSANEVRSKLREEANANLQLNSKAPAEHLRVSKIYETTKSATLMLGHLFLCGSCDKLHGSAAGGVIISPDGLVLTNYHVLNNAQAKAFGAMTSDKQIFPIAEVLASSKKHDLAIIRLEGATDLPFLPLADAAEIGEKVFLVSHPDSHFFTLSTGLISRYYIAPKAKAPRLQITADFARGSSGCGVVNQNGQLVGLVTSTNSIYYTQEKDLQKDLQMVVNSCVPLRSILDLLGTRQDGETSTPP